MLALACAMTCNAHAEQSTVPAEPLLVPVVRGYAFNNPDLLLRQRIFGLAHGVHLLLSACLDKSESTAAIQAAYDSWHPAQEKTLATVRRTLAAHHFGEQAERAQWQDIARLFNLKETIYPALGSTRLLDACASFPDVLRQPRYDFAAQLGTNDDGRARPDQ